MNLTTLLITNFRSLRGTVAIPLDAPVILLHGLNGMGKTSVLSAIELALTGEIAHLHRVDKDYERHLLHQDADSGSVAIFSRSDGPNEATITLTREGGSGSPLLGDEDAKFFSERCYLPQSALGRLLELYQDANTDEKTSPLTQFVKDLLGLDQLDALVEGLNPAFHIARIRNLVPEYRRYENLVASLKQEVDSKHESFESLLETIGVERAEIEHLLATIYEDETLLKQLHTNPRALVKAIEEDSNDTAELSALTSARQELEVYEERFAALPKDVASAERDLQENEHVETKSRLHHWTANDGKRLSDLIASLSDLFPDLPSPLTSGPIRAHNVTELRVNAEKERCERVLADNQTGVARLKVLDSEIQKSLQKIAGTDNELKQLSEHADALARALAGLVPHVHDDDCPVCGRDFQELEQGPLSARLSATIASLTTESGRLKFLANVRVEESDRATINHQERRQIQSSLIPVADVSNLSLRVATLTEALSKLNSLRDAALAGMSRVLLNF
jgi:exonuclease SbcC